MTSSCHRWSTILLLAIAGILALSLRAKADMLDLNCIWVTAISWAGENPTTPPPLRRFVGNGDVSSPAAMSIDLANKTVTIKGSYNPFLEFRLPDSGPSTIFTPSKLSWSGGPPRRQAIFTIDRLTGAYLIDVEIHGFDHDTIVGHELRSGQCFQDK
jgi:hypothetical protein